jgi:thioredoxin-like negative regulator of GroEL
VVAKVDSTVAEKVSQELGVEGYPTLKFIANGFAVDYDGPRTAEGIQSWIEEFLNSKIATLSELEVKEKIGSEDFLLVQGATEEQLKVLQIANAVDTTVEYYLLPAGESKLTLYLKNSKTIEFTKELTVKALTKWTRESTLPIVVPLLSKDHVRLVF